jgi:hypothetical protein
MIKERNDIIKSIRDSIILFEIKNKTTFIR